MTIYHDDFFSVEQANSFVRKPNVVGAQVSTREYIQMKNRLKPWTKPLLLINHLGFLEAYNYLLASFKLQTLRCKRSR